MFQVKRTVLLMLIAFYILIISGVSVSLHFCCGNLKAISFSSTSNENSCCKSKKSNKRCCHDTTTFIKVKEKHFAGDTIKVRLAQFEAIYLVSNQHFNSTFNFVNSDEFVVNFHSPPPKFKTPIYLKNNVFII